MTTESAPDLPPAIGVVLVNYRSWEKLDRCLASLKEHGPAGLRYIVVDNSPEDESRLILAAHPEVKALVPGANLGFAGGCNLGMALALDQGVDFILLLNPDTIVEHDFITPLVAELKRDQGRAAAGPKILRPGPGEEVWYGGCRMNWWLGGPSQVRDARHDGPAFAVPSLSGCAMLLNAQAVRRVGMMDERYFLYYEDSDYCQRLLRAGFTLAYLPSARLRHEVSSTVGFQSRDYVYFFSRNRVWFMRRWARRHHYLAFMLYNTLVKLPGAVLIFGLLRRRPDLMLAYFSGFFAGIASYPPALTSTPSRSTR